MIRLSGNSISVNTTPQNCQNCGCKELYKQPDFKRSIGLALVTIASLATFVLLYFGYNWWTVWSPMFFVLLVDRIFAVFSPLAVICYKCGSVHRGLRKEQCEPIPSFDLEVYDRIHYAEKMEEGSS